MDPTKNLIDQATIGFIYRPTDILINLSLAFVFGLVVAFVYNRTHKGLSYSQSFMLTVVFVSIIVAMVMMVIGNNLSRAFALVGALSIIRFRTVLKDTKDMTYIFLSLAAGMAAGTSSYFLGFVGVVFFAIVAFVLHSTNYGSIYKSEFILRFRTATSSDAAYSDVINAFSKMSNLLHVEPSGDGQSTKVTFDVLMQKDKDPQEFSRNLAQVEGVSEVVLVASKNDVDY
jgi:uncharacterized membrane protein YhiD involved in acid resistance